MLSPRINRAFDKIVTITDILLVFALVFLIGFILGGMYT